MEKPEWVTNEASWIKTCKKVVARARDLEEGKIGVIHCAREMNKLAFWLRSEDDPDFLIFRGISSESDELPVGEERKNWSKSALEREDQKIVQYERACREVAVQAAQSLRQKFGSVL